MVAIGNFFFKYRNWLFIIFYALLFVPYVPKLFTAERFGENYYWWPIIIGLIITIAGQAIRAATIGLAYIIRGGKDNKVYAEDLVTSGIFAHCRNPLYVGNILMIAGVGILSNSLLYVVIMIPFFFSFTRRSCLQKRIFYVTNLAGNSIITVPELTGGYQPSEAWAKLLAACTLTGNDMLQKNIPPLLSGSAASCSCCFLIILSSQTTACNCETCCSS